LQSREMGWILILSLRTAYWKDRHLIPTLASHGQLQAVITVSKQPLWLHQLFSPPLYNEIYHS
jgi:hypothetical protein